MEIELQTRIVILESENAQLRLELEELKNKLKDFRAEVKFLKTQLFYGDVRSPKK